MYNAMNEVRKSYAMKAIEAKTNFLANLQGLLTCKKHYESFSKTLFCENMYIIN